MATLKIIQHNVLAWTYNRRNELYNVYREIDPDIVLINAHGMKESQRIKMFNYNVYQRNHLDENNAGVAIAIKRNIQHNIMDDLEEDYLAAKVMTNLGPLIIASGYQPPRLPHIPNHTLLRIFRNQYPVLFAGDLNARHHTLNHNNNNPAGEQINQLIRRGNTYHIGPHFKTYITPRSSGTPDIILTNNNFHHNLHIQPGPLTSSDHLPIIITVSTSPIQIPVAPRLDFRHANWENFNNDLSNIPIPNMDGQPVNCIDDEMSRWFREVKTAMSQNIPLINHRTLPHPKTTNELQLLQIAFSNLKRKASISGWTQHLRNTMKILQNNITNIAKQQRDRLWEELIAKTEQLYTQPEQFWRQIRQLSGTESDNKISYLLDPNGNKLSTDETQANEFKRHLSNIFHINQEDNDNFCQDTQQEVEEFLQNTTEHKHHTTVDYSRLDDRNPLIRPISQYEILRTIKSFKNKKAPGQSKIDKQILLKLPPNMIDYLREIFNAALSAGYFPRDFKLAIIKMILKKGKQNIHAVNYRPISLLETAGKTYEKILNARFKLFLHENNHNNPDQHAYQHNRGTSTAIAITYQRIAFTQQHHDQQCNLINRDISKAFDKVWHDGLKYKLCQLHMPRIFTATLCSFLDHRYAIVRVNNYSTTPFHLSAGVPQGAVLSPALFNLYTKDIKELRHSQHTAYADDVSQIVHYHGPSKNMMKLKTEQAIGELNEFEQKWKIKTNNNKFQVLHISKYNPLPLTIGQTNINYARETNVLGLTLKSRGIAAHVKKQRQKADTTLRKLRRFSQLSPRLKLRLYKALVLPLLDYPPIPTNTIRQSNWKSLQAVQNKALRWINKDVPPYERTVEDLHTLYNIEPINIRNFKLAKNAWNKMRREFPDETALYETTVFDRHHAWWPLAYIPADAEAPEPIFKKDADRQNNRIRDDNPEEE